jgi:hypothetical protein
MASRSACATGPRGTSARRAAAVPDAQLVMLPSVHLPNVAMPRAYEEVVLGFLLADQRPAAFVR